MTALISKLNITTLFLYIWHGRIMVWMLLPMSLPSINFLHLTVSEIKPGQDFIGQGHYSKVKGQINVTQSRCTPTLPNQCPYQVSTSYTLRF